MSLHDVVHILGQFILPTLFAIGAIGNLLIIVYFGFVNQNNNGGRSGAVARHRNIVIRNKQHQIKDNNGRVNDSEDYNNNVYELKSLKDSRENNNRDYNSRNGQKKRIHHYQGNNSSNAATAPTRLRKLTSYHYLIIQLALIDFLACVGSSLVVSHYHSYDHPWRLGGFGCKIVFPFLLHVCPLVSCWTLVLLSYERYRRITVPFRRRRNGKKEYAAASLVVLVLAVLFHLPTILQTRVVVMNPNDDSLTSIVNKVINNSSFGSPSPRDLNSVGVKGIGAVIAESVNRVRTSGERSMCFNGIQTFGTITAVLYRVANRLLDCLVPAALMCYYYRRMSACMKTDGALLSAAITNSGKSQQRNRLALRTLKNLILVYVMCVFPGRVLVLTQLAVTQYALGAEASRRNAPLISMVHLVLGLLYTSNNAVNVLVYARLVKGFRRFLRRLFCTCAYLHRLRWSCCPCSCRNIKRKICFEQELFCLCCPRIRGEDVGGDNGGAPRLFSLWIPIVQC